MIHRLKPYAKVSDSGVDWLGEIPSHWGVRRLRALVNIGTGAKDTIEQRAEGKYPFFVRSQNVARIDTWSFDGEAVLTAGDGDVGNVFHYIDGRFDYHQRVYKLSDFNGIQGKFFFHYFRSTFGHEVFQGTAKSTVESLRLPMLQNFPVVVPSATEQAAIARCLDHVTCRIERYIRAKEKLIALLEEQKLATVNGAVTGQIDVGTGRPYASYRRADGAEWLGSVPSHWETRRSKRLFRPRVELAQPGDIQLSATQAWGVISQAAYEKRIGRKVVRISQHLDKRRHVEVDDFVISMRSFQGGLERAWTRGCIRSSYVVLCPTTELSSDFFGFLFKSAAYINALRATADFIRDGQDLNFDNFCRVDLPFPPLDEQQRVAMALQTRLRKVTSLIEKSRRGMALLREFRVRLIADVVTGKLDVRTVERNLPPEDPTESSGGRRWSRTETGLDGQRYGSQVYADD